MSSSGPSKPAVVALGGGHGLAAALAAIRRFAAPITAVVSVADDGGSSGRLRRERGLPPPGDLRRCLVALAEDGSAWAPVMEYRFRGGALDGHALGNLIIAGLTETAGDFGGAIEEAGRLLRVVGTVVPATTEPVTLKADVEGAPVEGQVAVAHSPGRIGRVAIAPEDARAPGQAVQAIVEADLVVLAPGSLFTSLLPVLCVEDLRGALAATAARIVQVCNLRQQMPETEGMSGAEHLGAVRNHGARVDVFLYDPAGELDVHDAAVRALGAEPVAAVLGDAACVSHDATHLAAALRALL